MGKAADLSAVARGRSRKPWRGLASRREESGPRKPEHKACEGVTSESYRRDHAARNDPANPVIGFSDTAYEHPIELPQFKHL